MDDYGLLEAIRLQNVTQVKAILQKRVKDFETGQELILSTLQRTNGGNKDVPLLLSATLDDPTIISFFVKEFKIDVNQAVEIDASFRETTFVIISAIKANSIPVVQWLLNNGCNTDVVDGKGWNALHHAVSNMNYPVAKLVVARSMKIIDAENSDGNTPLHIATKAGHMDMVRLLVEEGGASVGRARSWDDMAAVHVAAKEGHSNIVDVFCSHYNVNPKAQFKFKNDNSYILRCPIHMAAIEGNFSVLEVLLSYCEVNTLDSSGNTPLHCCFIKPYNDDLMKPFDYYENCVKLLLNKQCNTGLANSQGESVYDLAEKNGYQSVIEMIRNPKKSYTIKSFKKPKRISKESKPVNGEKENDVDNETKANNLIKKRSTKKEKTNEKENQVERKTSRKTSFKNKLKKFESIGNEGDAEEADLTEWLEQQAQLLKNKNENEKTIPVAQSTPPPKKKFEKPFKNASESDNITSDGSHKKQRPPPPPKPLKKPKVPKTSNLSESMETASSEEIDSISQPKPVPRARVRNTLESELSPTKLPPKKHNDEENEKVEENSQKKPRKLIGVPVFPTAYKYDKPEDGDRSFSPTKKAASEIPNKAPKSVENKSKVPKGLNESDDSKRASKNKTKPADTKVALKPNKLKKNIPIKPVQQEDDDDDDEEEEEEDDEDEESEDSEDQRAMEKVLKKFSDAHIEDDDEDEDEEEEDSEEMSDGQEEDDDGLRDQEVGDDDVIVIPEPAQAFEPKRTRTVEITRNLEKKLGFSIVGGNHDGIFVNTVQKNSSGSLKPGEQIIEINGRSIHGKTKDDIYKLFETLTMNSEIVSLKLTDERKDVYQEIMKNGGFGGDRFYVKAKFSHDTGKKKDLSVREGDVFCVLDSLPDKYDGFWRAQKMTTTFRKPDDMNVGLIPNKQKGDQLALKQHLSSSSSSRNGAFMRSFRRAKSAEKLSQKGKLNESADNLNTSLTVVGYERVCQAAPSKRKRPVIVLGLFCDVVIDMLVNNSPKLFFTPAFSLENSNNEFDDSPIDLETLQKLMNEEENLEKRHLITIMNPATIDFLRKKTYIDPIVVFISPVSKSIVKSVKNQLAPQFNKSVSHLFEEASKFEKAYSHLFSSIVSYTVDEWWFFHLKEAITYCQQQGLWIPEDVAFASRKKKFITSSTSGSQPDSSKKILSRTMDNIKYNHDKQAKKPRTKGADGLPPKSIPQNSLPLPPKRSDKIPTVKKAVLPPLPNKNTHVNNGYKKSNRKENDDGDEDLEEEEEEESEDEEEESEEDESEEEEEEEEEDEEEIVEPVKVPKKRTVRSVKHEAVNGKKSNNEKSTKSSTKPAPRVNSPLKESNSLPLKHIPKAPVASRTKNIGVSRLNSNENGRSNPKQLLFQKSSNASNRETPL